MVSKKFTKEGVAFTASAGSKTNVFFMPKKVKIDTAKKIRIRVS